MRINLVLILYLSSVIVSVSSFTTAPTTIHHLSSKQNDNFFNDEINNKKSHFPPLLSHISKTKIILKHAKKIIHRTKQLQVTKRINSLLFAFMVAVSQRGTIAHAVESAVEPATIVVVAQPDVENAMITDSNVETTHVQRSSKRNSIKLMSGVVAGIGLGGALSKKKNGLVDEGKKQFEKIMDIVRNHNDSKMTTTTTTTTTTSEELDDHTPSKNSTIIMSDQQQMKKIRDDEIAMARRQPKSPQEEANLKEKYAKLPLEERAFQIFYDLGMIELTPDPDDADYDDSLDDELAPENIFPPDN